MTDVIAIAAGGSHTVALKSDGTVVTWGYNHAGELGDGSTIMRTVPVAVNNLTDITAIAADGNHTVALKNDGTVVAWGNNAYGQLGGGTIMNYTEPTKVNGLTNITDIATGNAHTVALKNNGIVVAWGKNEYGQLGDGRTLQRNIPYYITGAISDTAGSNFDSAYDISINQEITDSINTKGDADWYKFYVKQTDIYQVIANGNISMVLYDDIQMEVPAGTDGRYTLTGGKTYYLRVVGIEPCTYTLRVSGQIGLFHYTHKLGVVSPQPITALQSGFVTSGVTVRNNYPEAKKVVLIVTLRKKSGDTLINIATTEKTIASGSEDVLTGGFNVPDDYQNYKIEVMVWDSLTGMELISAPVVFQ